VARRSSDSSSASRARGEDADRFQEEPPHASARRRAARAATLLSATPTRAGNPTAEAKGQAVGDGGVGPKSFGPSISGGQCLHGFLDPRGYAETRLEQRRR
jgi:hypothetical protein